jgi:hypothetical protein
MSAFADIPAFTWGNRPAAGSVPAGTLIRISDVGLPGGIYMMSDGVSTWSAVGAQMLGRSAVAASVTGTTTETALATVTVPAGAMGPNGGIEIRSVWSFTNSANNKTLRVRHGGVAGTQFLTLIQTTNASYSDVRRIRNRASAASQIGSMAAGASGGLGTNSAALVTGANDSSTALDVVLTGQLALGSETLTLESYEVWLLP